MGSSYHLKSVIFKRLNLPVRTCLAHTLKRRAVERWSVARRCLRARRWSKHNGRTVPTRELRRRPRSLGNTSSILWRARGSGKSDEPALRTMESIMGQTQHREVPHGSLWRRGGSGTLALESHNPMLLPPRLTAPPLGGQLGIRGVKYAVSVMNFSQVACFLSYIHCYRLVSSGSELYTLPVHAFSLPLLLFSPFYG